MRSRSTAVHEAGHAVMGRVLGMVCGSASCEQDDDSAGHSICADPWATFAEWDRCGKYREFHTVMRGRIMAFMAGAEAEREIIGHCAGGDGDDRYQITMMLEEAEFAADLTRFEERLRQATRHLIRRHRAAIERLADALLQHGTLAAEQVDQLVMAQMKNPAD